MKHHAVNEGWMCGRGILSDPGRYRSYFWDPLDLESETPIESGKTKCGTKWRDVYESPFGWVRTTVISTANRGKRVEFQIRERLEDGTYMYSPRMAWGLDVRGVWRAMENRPVIDRSAK